MRLIVKTQSKTYPVIIEPKAFSKFKFPKQAIIITDSKVKQVFKKSFKKFPVIDFKAGEASKHLNTIEKLSEELVALKADRSSSVIAFGGGVVGDMAGFTASVYMRGIPFYQVPTTLLAMVDASVGGKTGVDLKVGKNLVGTFTQPEAVIIDPTYLVDLPEDQFNNGMAEVIKHGVLDKSLFEWLEKNKQKINGRDIKTLQTLLVKNVQIKKAVVEKDEKEAGIRMLLNLGHTFGHAVEQLSNYTIPHGEAVAIGLVYASNYTKMPEQERLIDLLHYFNLPSHLEKPYSASAMAKAMLSDKKHRGSKIVLVLPNKIGQVRINTSVTVKQMQTFLTKVHKHEV